MKPVTEIWAMIERGGMDALYYKALVHEYSIYTTSNEAAVFGGTTNDYELKGQTSAIGRTIDWSLPDQSIVANSVMIKDGLGNLFTEGTDYTVNYETGIVTRKPTGRLPRREYVYISYRWRVRCVEPSTGNPRMNCPQCGGKGFIWDTPIAIKGLFHIPSYSSPLTTIGYFEEGDAIFTVPANWDVGVGPSGIDNLFLRDRIDIAGESWRIMFKPETIQMQNNYIAKKLHLRRIKFTPGVVDGDGL